MLCENSGEKMCDKLDLQIRNINSNEKIRVLNLNKPTTTCILI